VAHKPRSDSAPGKVRHVHGDGSLDGDLGDLGSGGAVTPGVPDPGDVVEVRGSRWAVSNVEAQGLPRSPADDGTGSYNHVVDLQSLDEDRLGEDLTVIWELEIGQTVTPPRGLPEQIRVDGFDDPVTLAGFIDAMRWGAVTSADPNRYQAPFWSGISVKDYQLEPLHRALSGPRANMLLADDVGLGKTIEAGLVVQELLLRHRARTVIVVCPPSLSLKWQDEMREKFGLEFVIVNSERMADVRRSHGLQANPFTLFPRVIVSMAWLSSVRAQRLLRSVYDQASRPGSGKRFAFDVLVVDEAHHVAPSSPSAVAGGRGYAVDTQRTVAVRGLADTCEHRLFLSATPHNGHPESFTSLMEMIDPQRFSRGALLDQKALREVAVRRLKANLPSEGFPPRQVESLPYEPSDEEETQFALLDEITRESAKKNGKKTSGDIVTMLLKKRFLSSPFAFGCTLENYLAADEDGALTDDYYEDILGEGQSDEEEGLRDQDESERLRESKGSDPLSSANTEQLEQLAVWAQSYENRPDAKLDRLIAFLDAVCRPDEQNWLNERVVVFTEYVDTLEWIERVLRQHGYDEDRLAVIQGSTPVEDRELIRERFNEDPSKEPIRVLLATDAAGEGIDLQSHCHRLVNFDIPFNPSRLEQRIGRIDRFGQKEDSLVFHFATGSDATAYAADSDFMARIARKVATVAEDLGSVNPVVAANIQAHFSGGPSPGLDSATDPSAQIINKAMAGEQELNSKLTEFEQNYETSRTEMHLEPANLRRVVDTALRISHQELLQHKLDELTQDDVYDVPSLASDWEDALKGLYSRLEPDVRRPITFDADVATDRNDLVYVHLGHPIVQKAQKLLRKSLWSADSQLERVTAVVVDDLDESFVAAVTRMVLVGRGGVRLHEEVFLAGVRLRGRRSMAEEKAEAALEKALDSDSLELAGYELREPLTELWNAPESPLHAALDRAMKDRANRKKDQLVDLLLTREESDKARVSGIFSAFRENLKESLAHLQTAEEENQAQLWADDQQKQRQRDIAAMKDRLESLEEEEAQELAAILERYVDIKHDTTAAAVVFALTRADAEQGLL